MTQRLGFGVFLAPHHPIGEHPTLQFQRDLELADVARRTALRRVLGRRASFRRMGNDRVAGNVSGRGGGAHQANKARHRRRLDPVPSSVQRRAAHRDARSSEPRARDARGRSRRAAVGRGHARNRSDDAARPDGRGPRRDPAAAHRGRAVQLQGLVVRAEQRGAADSSAAGKNSHRGRVDDLAVGDEDRGQIRRGRAVGRVVLRRRFDGAADAMEFRRDLGARNSAIRSIARTGES